MLFLPFVVNKDFHSIYSFWRTAAQHAGTGPTYCRHAADQVYLKYGCSNTGLKQIEPVTIHNIKQRSNRAYKSAIKVFHASMRYHSMSNSAIQWHLSTGCVCVVVKTDLLWRRRLASSSEWTVIVSSSAVLTTSWSACRQNRQDRTLPPPLRGTLMWSASRTADPRRQLNRDWSRN